MCACTNSYTQIFTNKFICLHKMYVCIYASKQVGVKYFQLFATDVVIGSVSGVAVQAGTYGVFTKLNKPLQVN